jgi:hypothetical protein
MNQAQGTATRCVFRTISTQVAYTNGGLHFTDCLFEDNNCPSAACVYYTTYSNYITGNVISSEFYRNRGTHIVQYNSIIGTDPNFSNNTMYNNTVTNPSTGSPLTFNGILGGHYNYFNNPACNFELRILTANNQPAQNFSLNYWGSSDEATVLSRIYDFNVDSTKAKAIYLPYLMSTDHNDLSPYETTLTFIGPNSTISGETTEVK